MVGTSGQANAPFNDRNVSLEALAESEQRSRTLVEALPDAILVHSEDKIVFVNPFCVRLLAAAGPEQLLGKDIDEIVSPDESASNKKSNSGLLRERNGVPSNGVCSDRL
jgi:PAS domain S-box-containing protein